MLSSKKILAYLAYVIAAFAAVSLLLREILVEVLLLLLVGCVLVGGLLEGTFSFGQGSAKRKYKRSDSPIAYWSIAVLWCVIITIIALGVFYGKRRI